MVQPQLLSPLTGRERFRTLAHLVVGAAIVLSFSAPSTALGQEDEYRLAGSKLVLKTSKILVVSNDPDVVAPTRSEVVDDLQGSAFGAFLEVCTGNGTGGRLWLDYRGWEITPNGTVKFRGARVDSSIRKVVVKTGRKLVIKGRTPLVELTGDLGNVAVQFITARGVRCVEFSADAVDKDEPGRFKARGAPRPSSCAASVLCPSSAALYPPHADGGGRVGRVDVGA